MSFGRKAMSVCGCAGIATLALGLSREPVKSKRVPDVFFSDSFSGSTVGSSFSALGDASLSESGGKLHVSITSSGGVRYTAPNQSGDSLSYIIIPNTGSQGSGSITEYCYVKDGQNGTEHKGDGYKLDNSDNQIYSLAGNGSGGETSTVVGSFSNNVSLKMESRWKYDKILDTIPVACYNDRHWIALPPLIAARWIFNSGIDTAVASYSSAMITKVEIQGSSSFDLDIFSMSSSDLEEGGVDVSPDYGTASGGTTVQLNAWGNVRFSDTSYVKIAGTSVSFTIDSATKIEFTTPAHSAGIVKVEFDGTNSDGNYYQYVQVRGFRFE